jgi:hypothetical protein
MGQRQHAQTTPFDAWSWERPISPPARPWYETELELSEDLSHSELSAMRQAHALTREG